MASAFFGSQFSCTWVLFRKAPNLSESSPQQELLLRWPCSRRSASSLRASVKQARVVRCSLLIPVSPIVVHSPFSFCCMAKLPSPVFSLIGGSLLISISYSCGNRLSG